MSKQTGTTFFLAQCRILAVCAVGWLLFTEPVRLAAAEFQQLRGHVPAAVASSQPVGRLTGTNYLRLAISLPLRNLSALTNLLAQIYNPASTNYHHYLTPAQFTQLFGPTEGDYQAVKAFAQANGLDITGTHANRTLLDVGAPASQIERAFHVHLRLYPLAREGRNYFAPDAEPSLNLAVPVLHVSGLDNFIVPHPMDLRKSPASRKSNAKSWANTGSGPGGDYLGGDFRKAYVPGTLMTGLGQQVGLLQLASGFYQSDITNYEYQAGLPDVPVTPVLLDGYNGGPGQANDECSLDIEMAIAMAPGLSQVLVYEGVLADDILNQMANDDLAQQLSSSYSFAVDSGTEQTFMQFAMQGQSFFNASGDNGAWVGGVASPCDDPNITSVGGTSLTTDTNGVWVAETVWNWSATNSSGGGISTTYPIPSWQQGVSMTLNQGSATMRNIPDVSLTADNIYVVYDNGTNGTFGGTSCASPLWAGFAALINQQATNNGISPVGLLNPAIYNAAEGPGYNNLFNDITTGNNTNNTSDNLYFAALGYDLCTGWGTPAGQALIDALVGPADPTPAFIITEPQGQTNLAGSSVTFSVVPGGLPPFGYQWTLNQTNLAGATNEFLTINNVQPGEAGNYAVLVTNAYGSILSSNAVLVVHLQSHFAWGAIPPLRFVNVPFTATIQAQNATNGIVTNFTGAVNLTSALGVPIQPAMSGAFVQGSWTGSVMVTQSVTNLVLEANDGLGDLGLANPINIVNPPALGAEVSDGVLLAYWPTSIAGFVIETSPQLEATNWMPVTAPPVMFGDQYLEAFPMTSTNGFFRLRYTLP